MMRGRSRFRGRRPSWDWAKSSNFSQTDSAVTFYSVGDDLLPPGRTKWLCEQRGRDHVTCMRILLWLSLWVRSTNETNPVEIVPAVDLWVIKTASDINGNEPTIFAPFVSPIVPAGVTSWAGTENDGGDPFLWCTRMWTKQAGSHYWQTGTALKSANNTTDMLQATAEQGDYAYDKGISLSYQPAVDIRVKRRLSSIDALRFGMSFTGLAAGATYFVNYACRVLLK